MRAAWEEDGQMRCNDGIDCEALPGAACCLPRSSACRGWGHWQLPAWMHVALMVLANAAVCLLHAAFMRKGCVACHACRKGAMVAMKKPLQPKA